MALLKARLITQNGIPLFPYILIVIIIVLKYTLNESQLSVISTPQNNVSSVHVENLVSI